MSNTFHSSNNFILKIDHLIEGKIIKRPSKIIKSPYVADIIFGENENEILDNDN